MSLWEQVARAKARWPLTLGVLVLASIPMVRAVALVRSSTKLQYADYWPILDLMLSEEGGWTLRGIIAPRNEHPIVLPKLLYLINAEWFGGSNTTLGFMVILVVAIQVVLVFFLALRTEQFNRWAVAALTVAASFLLYTPQGAWNFVKAMSGTAWLTANLFVLSALVVQRCDRRFLTPAFGVAATLSYGTGLAVWPALAVAAVLQHRRNVVRQWPTFLAGAVSVGCYLIWYSSRPPSGIPRPSFGTLVENTLKLIGSSLAEGGAAVALGAVVVLSIAALSLIVARQRGTSAWVALGVYGCGACLLVSLGRSEAVTNLTASRYASLPALTWLALTALVLAVLPARWWVALVPVPLVLVFALGGQAALDTMERTRSDQELRAIALRTGAEFGPSPLGQPFPDIGGRLDGLGHYPFNSSFSADCGQLGDQVPVGGNFPPGVRGRIGQEIESADYPGARLFAGVVTPAGTDVDCVVVVDSAGTVVGAGAMRPADTADALLFTALAPQGEASAVYVRLAGSERFVRLEDPSGVFTR